MNQFSNIIAKKLQEVSEREIELSIIELKDTTAPIGSRISVTYILGTDSHTIQPAGDKRKNPKEPLLFDHVGVIKAGFDLEFHKLQIIVKDNDSVIGKKEIRVSKLSRVPEQKWYKLSPQGQILIELVAVNWGKIPKPSSQTNDLSHLFLTRSLGKIRRTFVREYKKPDIKRELPHIAAGTFGIVYKGTVRDKRGIVAIKDIKVKDYTTFEAWKKEVDFMSSAMSKYVVEVYGFCCSPQLVTIVMEFLDKGTLFDLLHKKGSPTLTSLERLKMARHCSLAVAFLHSRNVLHRDVKSLNILVSADNVCKLSDFGSAKLIGNEQIEYYTAGKGTPFWMAPEVMLGQAYNLSADVYSLGIVLFELFEYKLPLYDTTIKSIVLETYNFPAAGIILPMLDRRLAFRPSAMETSQNVESILINLATILNLDIPPELKGGIHNNSSNQFLNTGAPGEFTTVGISLAVTGKDDSSNYAENFDSVFSPDKIAQFPPTDIDNHILKCLEDITIQKLQQDTSLAEDEEEDDEKEEKEEKEEQKKQQEKVLHRKRSMSQETLTSSHLTITEISTEQANTTPQQAQTQSPQTRARGLTRTHSSPLNSKSQTPHNPQQQGATQKPQTEQSQPESQPQTQTQTQPLPQPLPQPIPQSQSQPQIQPLPQIQAPQPDSGQQRPPRPQSTTPKLPDKKPNTNITTNSNTVNTEGTPPPLPPRNPTKLTVVPQTTTTTITTATTTTTVTTAVTTAVPTATTITATATATATTSSQPKGTVVNQNAIAIYEFVPQAKVELHVKEGERLTVVELRGPWAKVIRKTDGASGWVPHNYLQVF